ncbi:MAG TPA: FAD-dependent monooxygenase [Longimicrobium sp.]|uniref:FAD-dependent monooxygenase n=1 Tax=Longimicrobium sp. TaxID=2029185 RepID=UPI002ED7AD34
MTHIPARDGGVVDVAVLGGGTAGAVAALLLARAGCSAAVLERRAAPPDFTIGEGLPPTVHPLLDRLRLLNEVRAGPHLPAYANRSAWGGEALRDHDFIRTPYGHGFHLDRAAFDEALLARAARAGAAVHRGVRVTGRPRREGGAWRFSLADGGSVREMAARFVIDATGRAAAFARAAGARRERYDRLVAFWCVLPAADAGDQATLTESFAQGWWYTAGLPGGRRVVALMTDADTSAARAARTAAGFGALLAATRHVHAACGGAAPAEAPAASGAGTARIALPYGDAWLAAGDAALSFDPLSSQGILTAIYSAEKAAAAAYHVLRGSHDALPRYAALLDSIFAGYLHDYPAAYAAERRWPDEPFWRRRASPPHPLVRRAAAARAGA